MKKIYAANLYPVNTNNEYRWHEFAECEHSHEWDGDVRGYVENLLDDPNDIIEDHNYAIQNFPNGAILVGYNGLPHSIFWASERDDVFYSKILFAYDNLDDYEDDNDDNDW